MPAFREKTAHRGEYSPAPLDKSSTATFFVNSGADTPTPRFLMLTLAFHEGTPGHHFQIALTMHIRRLPSFRQMLPFSGYIEGWAVYAEQLAAESGLQNEPLDRLGFLSAQLVVAAVLVVDTGLHSMRWTRAEAVEYLTLHTAIEPSEIEALVNRHTVCPGQLCSYMVGMLKILELRTRAQEKLGARFDLKAFHDTVLGTGAVPLPVLEAIVDRWLASQG